MGSLFLGLRSGVCRSLHVGGRGFGSGSVHLCDGRGFLSDIVDHGVLDLASVGGVESGVLGLANADDEANGVLDLVIFERALVSANFFLKVTDCACASQTQTWIVTHQIYALLIPFDWETELVCAIANPSVATVTLTSSVILNGKQILISTWTLQVLISSGKQIRLFRLSWLSPKVTEIS